MARKKAPLPFGDLLIKAIGGPEKLEYFEMESEAPLSMSVRMPEGKGFVNRIFIAAHLREDEKAVLIEREMRHLFEDPEPARGSREVYSELFELMTKDSHSTPALEIKSVIIPQRTVAQGILVRSVSVAWGAVVDRLSRNWDEAYQLGPEVWEELIAGAYSKAGFDEVTLTPRSGDFGRDVIAIRRGIGCIKIIGSVKAYKPGHLVKQDDVRALLGVMSGERDTSKGIITTTSGFAPRITSDPFIKPFLPTRLELMDGEQTRKWLLDLATGRS